MKSVIFLSPGWPARSTIPPGLFVFSLSVAGLARAVDATTPEESGASGTSAHEEPETAEPALPESGIESVESEPAMDASAPPAPEAAASAQAPSSPSGVPVAGEARVLAPVATAVVIEPPPDPNSLPFTYHQKHIDIQLAFGPGWLTDSGIEPFSSSEGVAQLGLRVGAAALAVGRFAFVLLGEGAYGSVSGNARGSRSSLEFGILGIGLEARYHFHHMMYGFARLSPGAGFAQTSLTDGGVYLSGDGWQPTFAGHLGLAARIVGPADGSVRAPRVWLGVEAGYRYSGDYALTLRAPEESPVSAAEFPVPPFSLVGPDASLLLMLSF